MKRFLIRILVFILLLGLVDYAYGSLCRLLESRAKGGQALKTYEVSHVITPDLLILGSSRAVHTYDPVMLEDSLNVSAYVAGQDGNGIVMMYPVLRMVASRHLPETVVYDITPGFDAASDELHRYLSVLRRDSGRNEVTDSVITDVDGSERFKLLSLAYRYNSNLMSLVKGWVGSEPRWPGGYWSLSGRMNADSSGQDHDMGQSETSEYKMQLFREMAQYCRSRGIELILVYSPSYAPLDELSGRRIKDIEQATGLSVYDYSEFEFEGPRTEYFVDPSHLNRQGSVAFTKETIRLLREQ